MAIASFVNFNMAEIEATRQNMGKVANETVNLQDRQQEHEDIMMSISEDIGQLEGVTRYIPEHVQEHTTITVTSVVLLFSRFFSLHFSLFGRNLAK